MLSFSLSELINKSFSKTIFLSALKIARVVLFSKENQHFYVTTIHQSPFYPMLVK